MPLFQPFSRAHGMDLSDYAIRIAEIELSRRGPLLKGHNEITLEPGMIFEGEVKASDKVREKLIQLYKGKHGKISSPFVAISVPDRKTFTKVITMNVVPVDQLDEAIQFEAEQHFPIETGDMYLAWAVIAQNQKQITVLISATQKSILDTYASLLESIGKQIIIAEPEAVAIQRALIADESTPTLIIDLGASKTGISIIVDGILRYTSTTVFSGRELTRLISEKLSLTHEQADKAKTLFGLNEKRGKGVLKKFIAPLFNPLFNHINEIQEYYATHFETLPHISRIVLCGGGAQMESIVDFFKEHFALPVETRIPHLSNEKQIQKNFPRHKLLSFATVIGLAIRGNLQNPFTMISHDETDSLS